MKIERKENGLVEFGSLKCGDVFKCKKEDDIWMKIKETSDRCINCIDILDGSHGWLSKDVKVKPYPNARLVLED